MWERFAGFALKKEVALKSALYPKLRMHLVRRNHANKLLELGFCLLTAIVSNVSIVTGEVWLLLLVPVWFVKVIYSHKELAEWFRLKRMQPSESPTRIDRQHLRADLALIAAEKSFVSFVVLWLALTVLLLSFRVSNSVQWTTLFLTCFLIFPPMAKPVVAESPRIILGLMSAKEFWQVNALLLMLYGMFGLLLICCTELPVARLAKSLLGFG